VSLLEGLGYQAVAPELADFFKLKNLPGGYVTNWSQRHIAYAAGLGTFSLNDGFITTKGMAMRCGSVVTDALIPPSPEYTRTIWPIAFSIAMAPVDAVLSDALLALSVSRGMIKTSAWSSCLPGRRRYSRRWEGKKVISVAIWVVDCARQKCPAKPVYHPSPEIRADSKLTKAFRRDSKYERG